MNFRRDGVGLSKNAFSFLVSVSVNATLLPLVGILGQSNV